MHIRKRSSLFCRKIDRFIYLIAPSTLIGSLLTEGCWWGYDKVSTVFFHKSGSVARVWAAFRERSYEEGPTDVGGALEVQKFLHLCK